MLTRREIELIDRIDKRHRDVQARGTVLRKQLSKTHHSDLDKPLSDAIALEGQTIGELVTLARKQQREDIDVNPDDARKDVSETQWGCGQ